MKSTSRTRTKGFTLIELAIVLVIIGLLIGGVMVGRDLIDSSNLRKDQSSLSEYNAAINTFKLKYNYLPGDLPNATNFGFDAASSGDGDGRIQLISMYNGPTVISSINWTYRAEWFRVFHHLGRSGLVAFDGSYNTSATSAIGAGTYYPRMVHVDARGLTGTPTLPHPGIIVAWDDRGEFNPSSSTHLFRFGMTPYPWAANSYVDSYAGYTPFVAKRIDTKFDDGLALSGRMQTGNTSVGATAWYCVDSATSAYRTNDDYRVCTFRVKAEF